MSIYKIFMKNAVEVKRILNRTHYQSKYTKYLKSIERISREELWNLQAIELSKILKHTVDNVPFYSKYKGQFKLTTNTVFDDIKHFPIINKYDLLNKYDELISPIDKQHAKKTTGGTTGRNTVVVEDLYGNSRRCDEYFNKMANLYPGMRRIILGRSEHVHFYDNQKNPEKTYNYISQTYRISHTFFNQEKLDEVYRILSTKKIEAIGGQTNSVYELAKYIVDIKKEAYYLSTVIVGGQTMLPYHREIIKKAFGNNLYDEYGATEFNNLCQECEIKNGLHYSPVTFYNEILDINNNQVKEGERGKLIVTLLNRKVMPIIRYDVKDMAVHTERYCECGRTFPLIQSIDGRHVESIVSEKGTFIAQQTMMHILSKYCKVTDYQVQQYKLNHMVVRLLNNSGKLTKEGKLGIQKEVEKILMIKMKVDFEYVSHMKALPNGKAIKIIALEK